MAKYIVKPKANGVGKQVFDSALDAIAFWEKHTGMAMHKEGKTLTDPITGVGTVTMAASGSEVNASGILLTGHTHTDPAGVAGNETSTPN